METEAVAQATDPAPTVGMSDRSPEHDADFAASLIEEISIDGMCGVY